MRKGNNETVNGFSAHAAGRFPCRSWWIARSDPQPGQYHPVRYLRGQGGKRAEVSGSKRVSATSAAADPTRIATGSSRSRGFRIRPLPLTVHATQNSSGYENAVDQA